MNVTRNVLALIALSALASSSIGQENQQPAPTEPTKPAAQSPPAANPPPAPAPGGAQSTPPQRMPVVKDDEFIPTQELQADEEVTFPVDI
jgi:hypothetical protein